MFRSTLVYGSQYQAMIRAMDIGVKQIYKAAQEQTDRETIIVFTSDNGAAQRFREWSDIKKFPDFKFSTATGCNYPLKGSKSSLNEAGFQIFRDFEDIQIRPSQDVVLAVLDFQILSSRPFMYPRCFLTKHEGLGRKLRGRRGRRRLEEP